MSTQRHFGVSVAGLVSGRCLSIALCLVLGPLGALGLGADQDVINTNDSGAGSLRQAVADVGAGENVVFQPAVAGGTIGLSSGLVVARSMNFVNDSGGEVTVNLNAHLMSVADGSTIGLDTGLNVLSTWATAFGCTISGGGGSYTIDGLHSDIAMNAVTLSGHTIAAFDLNVTGGLSGTVTAEACGTAWGLYAENNLNVVGNLSGTVTAESTVGEAYGLHADNDLTVADGVSGIITATALNNDAYALHTANTMTIAGGLSGTVTAEASDHAIGLYVDNDLTISGGLTGVVTANASWATGLYAGDSVTINDGLAGTVTAEGSDGATAIYAGNVSVAGDLSGTVQATAHSGDAFGLFSSGNVNGGDADTPLVITGSVLADGETCAVGIYGSGVNAKVDAGGTLSAVSSAGDAWAIQSYGDHDDQVELVAGCTLVGDVYLGEGTDTLTLSGATGSTTMDGQIHLAEFINVTGGTWTLNGQIFSGPTLTVYGGTLLFNNAISGDTTVEPGGTLGGCGHFGNLGNSGTVAPGNSIGILTGGGDYTQNPGSVLEIEINDAGQRDQLNVNGAATLNGGTVDVVAESGDYTAGMSYVFLNAGGGRTGEFDCITDNLPFLNAVLVYGADWVGFFLEQSHTPYVDVAQTFNQYAVAGYLDDHYVGATGDFANVLQQLDMLTAPDARAAFDAMGGELYGSLATIGIEGMDLFTRTVAWRLRARNLTRAFVLPAAGGTMVSQADYDDSIPIVRGQDCGGCGCGWLNPQCWQSWAEGYGVGAAVAGNGNASGLGYSVGGVAYGIERDLDPCTLFGLVGGYSQIYTLLDERADRCTIDSAQAGMYLHHGNECSYASAIAAYGYNGYDSLRHVTVGQINRVAMADYGGNNFSIYLEAGRNYCWPVACLQPYVALEYIQVHQDGFVEAGADSLDLEVGGIGADAFRGLLGTRLIRYFQTRGGRLASLEGRALWRHEFLDEARVLDARFFGQPGGQFVVNGLNVDRDAAILGGGLTLCLSDGVKLYANYDVLTSTNHTAHAGSGGLMLLW